ncbi:MAG: hypothetical protein O7C67_12675 [Gammaproteobacteria bacterium]|nr:hypothetical protein [Gammaproteobacteria bacterium]
MRLVGVVIAVLIAVAACAVQSSEQSEGAYVAPRGPGGIHPDLNGIWQVMNEANYDLERHMARSAMQEREGPYGPLPVPKVLYLGAVGSVPPGVGVVEGGKIPYTDEALAIKQENQQNWLQRDPEVKCYLPGVPRATYIPQPFQIFQGDDKVFIAYQYAGAVRDIYMEDPGPAPIDTWMGWSAGRWEGDTLVVEVTGLSEQSWLDRSGNHHSAQMKVTERYTRIGPDHIQYEATIEDPETFTRPWKISMPLYRRMEDNAKLMDFRCVEFVEELMYGEWRKEPLER